jgi:hypothetical protein
MFAFLGKLGAEKATDLILFLISTFLWTGKRVKSKFQPFPLNQKVLSRDQDFL